MTATLELINSPFPDGSNGLALFVDGEYAGTLQVVCDGYRTLEWPESVVNLPEALAKMLAEAKAASPSLFPCVDDLSLDDLGGPD